jgi:hypothetical protein
MAGAGPFADHSVRIDAESAEDHRRHEPDDNDVKEQAANDVLLHDDEPLGDPSKHGEAVDWARVHQYYFTVGAD